MFSLLKSCDLWLERAGFEVDYIEASSVSPLSSMRVSSMD
jgi:hypothetical protein